ncbi:phosphoglycerate mutase [Bacillus paramycoides]|uniref:phosphoglycerate mutase n=1 Tax=Bacillus paramycoides TaxID=2026194 RepID=UPI0015B8384B|nr:phosphoglycerate mutase [Bacillus paramycoides]NWK68979.1 phosphoglycerate mutase [Bacillus paramycoides]
MNYLVYFVGAILWAYINGFFTSDKGPAPWIKDDERDKDIKHKAIIASWSGIFFFCIIGIFNKALGLGGAQKSPYLPEPIATILQENVEIQVLLILLLMYGIFYIYYRKQMSA